MNRCVNFHFATRLRTIHRLDRANITNGLAFLDSFPVLHVTFESPPPLIQYN